MHAYLHDSNPPDAFFIDMEIEFKLEFYRNIFAQI